MFNFFLSFRELRDNEFLEEYPHMYICVKCDVLQCDVPANITVTTAVSIMQSTFVYHSRGSQKNLQIFYLVYGFHPPPITSPPSFLPCGGYGNGWSG